MNSVEKFTASTARDAQLFHALHLARYALVTHSGNTMVCEDTKILMNFEIEITLIDDAMRLLGFDPSKEVMLAPCRFYNPDEDDHG